MADETIYFFHLEEPYGCLSNASRHPILLDGSYWQTVEHYFQTAKFEDADLRDTVRRAETPGQARRLGRKHRRSQRRDWHDIKVGVMRKALVAKVNQHADVRATLRATASARLAQSAEAGSFWGGEKNMLGKLWMQVRERRKARPAPTKQDPRSAALSRREQKMPMSDYYKSLRDKVGHSLLMMPAVAAVIHDAEGRVLMMRQRADGEWSLPAGAIEPGESPTVALVREVAEETGLEVVPTKLLDVLGGPRYRVTYPNDDEVEYTILVYAADVRAGELHAADGEALEFGWFDPYDAPETGVYYPPELLAQTRLGPPPNTERLAEGFDLPRDTQNWSSVPFGICSTCALRFDGGEYRSKHGFVDDDVIDAYFRTGELSANVLERWTAFFFLQRGLGGRGLERSPANGRYYRAFYDLFLDLYDTDIPPEYVRDEYELRWQRHYLPQLDDCVGLIRRIRAEIDPMLS